MKRHNFLAGVAPAIVATWLGISAPCASAANGSAARVIENYGKLPLHFEPNVGQVSEGVRYLSRSNRGALLLRDSDIVLRVGVAKHGTTHTLRMTLPIAAMSRL